jgi:hypothetical protein
MVSTLVIASVPRYPRCSANVHVREAGSALSPLRVRASHLGRSAAADPVAEPKAKQSVSWCWQVPAPAGDARERSAYAVGNSAGDR